MKTEIPKSLKDAYTIWRKSEVIDPLSLQQGIRTLLSFATDNKGTIPEVLSLLEISIPEDSEEEPYYLLLNLFNHTVQRDYEDYLGYQQRFWQLLVSHGMEWAKPIADAVGAMESERELLHGIKRAS